MGNIRLYGSTSGYTELAPPAVAPDGVVVLPSGTGTLALETGAWTAYTPATNCTVGNGSLTGAYIKIGKTVSYRARFILGSTSAIAADASIGNPLSELIGSVYVGSAYYIDVSLSAFYTGYTKNTVLGYQNTFGYIAATIPFTWATGDQILVSATYEAA